ncbi:hypothetical protein J1N35_001004 [Gossypium stocksii]|uniref:Uncharacterized protein n=1 Tax=Gossypium stocksii TaxID=47602 RepID=A0A9D3WIJ0_9ROSI|nr:hypothetical protein J1N35_001004 [Gossypium stocksii]
MRSGGKYIGCAAYQIGTTSAAYQIGTIVAAYLTPSTSATYLTPSIHLNRKIENGYEKEQQSIKEGQGLVEAKFNAIEQECKQLRDETDLMIVPTLKSDSILKARQQADFGTAPVMFLFCFFFSMDIQFFFQ